MLNKVLKIILILLAGSAMFYGGLHIYQKQSNLITFDSFQINKNANTLHILNANIFFNTHHNTSNLNQLKLPKSLTKTFKYFSSIKDFNSKFSKEIRVNYINDQFYLIFKHQSITNLIKELQKQLNITSSHTNGKLYINNQELFIKQVENYLVISNQKITYQKIKKSKTKINLGNYNYFFHSGQSNKTIFYTKVKNTTFSFTKHKSKAIIGKPTYPKNYFNFIPSNYNELYYYGSSYFQKDESTLLNNTDSAHFFIWIDRSFVHLKNGDKELIIGKQNDEINLKNILSEQTIELSSDSLLPPSLFRNNFEILFFKTNYNWSNILPTTKSTFNVYTEYNNYNVLGNSISAIDWFIRELQLGNQLNNYSKLNLPQKLNTLTIKKTDTSFSTSVKTWISKNEFIQIKSNNLILTDSISNFKLLSNFKSNQSITYINTFKHNDSLFILSTYPNAVICQTLNGEIKWQKEIQSQLIKPPTIINTNKLISFVLFHNNKVDYLNNKGQSMKGFPYNYNGFSKGGLVTRQNKDSPYRLLININNSIININLKAEPVTGWTTVNLNSPLKSELDQLKLNTKQLFYAKDIHDSIYVFDKFGSPLYTNHFQFNNKNQSPYINGIQNNLQILSFDNNYIKSKFLKDGHIDSTKIKLKFKPSKLKWLKNELLIEDFNHIAFYNIYGFIENEFQKPEPNLEFISTSLEEKNLLIFANLSKNQLYLLNNFGKQINKNPILGTSILSFTDNYLVVYYNAQIWIYQVKLN